MSDLLILKIPMTERRRGNLEKLADYLEALPEDYEHFDMESFYDHEGSCDLAESLDEEVADVIGDYGVEAKDTLYATSIEDFLNNCGTVACAIGHAPAAGIPLAKSHIVTKRLGGVSVVTGIDWSAYAKNFVRHESEDAWEFLFGGLWGEWDQHHWGAAARIRFLLDKGGVPAELHQFFGSEMMMSKGDMVPLYQPYRIDERQKAAA